MRVQIKYTAFIPDEMVSSYLGYARSLFLDRDGPDDKTLLVRLLERKGTDVDTDAMEWQEKAEGDSTDAT